MIYCKNCSRLLDEDVNSCPYCGHEDDAAKTPQEPSFSDDVDVKLRALDARIAHSEKTEPYQPDYAVTAEPPVNPASLPSAGYGPAARPLPVPPEEAAPGTGMYVGLIFLSVFVSLAGFIVGIVYMTNKSPRYRKMGLAVMLVSIAATLLWTVACCGILYVVGAESFTSFY